MEWLNLVFLFFGGASAAESIIDESIELTYMDHLGEFRTRDRSLES